MKNRLKRVNSIIDFILKFKRVFIRNFNKSIAWVYVTLYRFFIRRKTMDYWVFGAFGGSKFEDNSSILFNYVNMECKNITSFWIVNKDKFNTHKKTIRGRVLIKGTIRTNIIVLLSRVHMYSHGPLDISYYDIEKLTKNYKVFLGHGVDGFKKIKLSSKINSMNEAYNLHVSVSDFEKKIKNSQWNIDESKILVSGIPRYDLLFNKVVDNTNKIEMKEILYMPTWRDWILKDTKELNIFFDEIKRFLTSDKLKEIITVNKINFTFYLHTNMSELISKFELEIPHMKVLNASTSLQKEIIKSDLLITDYSSVAWDFLFLNKPTIFYQFDYTKYVNTRGSYLDMKTELFGPVFYDSDSLIEYLDKIINGGFDKSLSKFRDIYFKYFDSESCKRIVDRIEFDISNKESK